MAKLCIMSDFGMSDFFLSGSFHEGLPPVLGSGSTRTESFATTKAIKPPPLNLLALRRPASLNTDHVEKSSAKMPRNKLKLKQPVMIAKPTNTFSTAKNIEKIIGTPKPRTRANNRK